MAEIRDFRFRAQTWDDLGDRSLPSDHAAIRSATRKPTSRARDSASIQACPRLLLGTQPVAQRACLPRRCFSFPGRLQEACAQSLPASLCCGPPTAHGAELFITTTAMRAFATSILARSFVVAKLGSLWSSFDKITSAWWSQASHAPTLKKGWMPFTAFFRKKPKLTLHAVTEEEGRPLEDADEAGARVCRHWAGFFQARESDSQDRSRKTNLDYRVLRLMGYFSISS